MLEDKEEHKADRATPFSGALKAHIARGRPVQWVVRVVSSLSFSALARQAHGLVDQDLRSSFVTLCVYVHRASRMRDFEGLQSFMSPHPICPSYSAQHHQRARHVRFRWTAVLRQDRHMRGVLDARTMSKRSTRMSLDVHWVQMVLPVSFVIEVRGNP